MKNILTLSRFEFKKLFIKKALLVITAFMCLFNIINIVRHYDLYGGSNAAMNKAKYTVYTIYKGELTEEKTAEIDRLRAQADDILSPFGSGGFSTEYDPDKYYSGYAYGDAGIFFELSEEVYRLTGYSHSISELSSQAEEMLKNSYINDYYQKINQKTADIYGERELTVLTHNQGISDFFDYRFSSVLCIILLIIGTVLIFTADKDTGTSIYLESSVNGKGKSTAAKLIAAGLYAFFIALLFFVTDLISFTILLRIDGFEQPVYSLTNYFSTPYTMPIWQFIILYFLFRLLGFWCIISLTALITVILKKPILSVIGSFIFFVAMMLLKTYCLTEDKRWVNLFNPLVPITAPKYIKRYDTLNIFSEPIMFINAALLCIIFLTAFMCCGTILLSSFRKRRAKNV